MAFNLKKVDNSSSGTKSSVPSSSLLKLTKGPAGNQHLAVLVVGFDFVLITKIYQGGIHHGYISS